MCSFAAKFRICNFTMSSLKEKGNKNHSMVSSFQSVFCRGLKIVRRTHLIDEAFGHLPQNVRRYLRDTVGIFANQPQDRSPRHGHRDGICQLRQMHDDVLVFSWLDLQQKSSCYSTKHKLQSPDRHLAQVCNITDLTTRNERKESRGWGKFATRQCSPASQKDS